MEATVTEIDSPCLFPEPESDVAHNQQFCVYASPFQVGEQGDGSRYVSAQLHFRGMDGKSRKLESANGVVNTPIVAAKPTAPLRSNLDDPEEWELPCSDGESVCWDETTSHGTCCLLPNHQVWNDGLYLVLSDICGGTRVRSGEGARQCGICGKTDWVSPNVLPREQSAPFGDVDKEVLLEAASGHRKPTEPGLSPLVTSEHVMISSFFVSAVRDNHSW